ncbi:MAG: type II toxin-antitoxin system RelE/ParE family toxin [Legionellales bacterium]|nr:type II toxin-antitoxin system RelE/ParE family toxin [Legionellales bacterium]
MKQLNAYFYRTQSGNEPVKEWLKSLPKEDRKIIGEDIKTVQFGWPLGMPLVRSLGHGLWEIRSQLPSKRIARVIMVLHDNQIVLLHGLIKKTQKTPSDDLNLALHRKKEVMK